ncbi:MAG: hypothetical protein NT165_01490 [Candidatus Falkowbacteria bacterium]|nr:hypothetical protein [Candidatus Falkowbacteria bacterium]
MKKAILIFFGVIFFLLLIGAFYYGLFFSIVISEKSVGGETLVYREKIGDYSQSEQTVDDVYSELKNNFGIECSIGFGVFYDNPQQVAKDKLRSDLGCILPESASNQVSELQDSPNLKMKRNPIVKSIIAEFPYRNKVSYMLGVLMVYPKLTDYLNQHNYQPAPSMEIYDHGGHRIEYRMAVVEK